MSSDELDDTFDRDIINPAPVHGLEQSVHYSTTLIEASGPLPQPRELEAFEKIVPGSAERIIRMAETEGDHRRDIERQTTDANIRLANREFDERRLGQVFGLIIGLSVLAAVVWLALNDKQITSSILGAAGLAGLVGVFVTGRMYPRDDSGSTDDSAD